MGRGGEKELINYFPLVLKTVVYIINIPPRKIKKAIPAVTKSRMLVFSMIGFLVVFIFGCLLIVYGLFRLNKPGCYQNYDLLITAIGALHSVTTHPTTNN